MSEVKEPATEGRTLQEERTVREKIIRCYVHAVASVAYYGLTKGESGRDEIREGREEAENGPSCGVC